MNSDIFMGIFFLFGNLLGLILCFVVYSCTCFLKGSSGELKNEAFLGWEKSLSLLQGFSHFKAEIDFKLFSSECAEGL